MNELRQEVSICISVTSPRDHVPTTIFRILISKEYSGDEEAMQVMRKIRSSLAEFGFTVG